MQQLSSDECGDGEYHHRCEYRLGGIYRSLTRRAIFLDLGKHCGTDCGVYQRENRDDGLDLLFHETVRVSEHPLPSGRPPIMDCLLIATGLLREFLHGLVDREAAWLLARRKLLEGC